MPLQRLPWRISLPFLAIVLIGSIALVTWISWNHARQELAQFQNLARTNAHFLTRMNLPTTDRMARQLTEVLGHPVYFRTNHTWQPQPLPNSPITHAINLPSDSQSHRFGPIEAIAIPLTNNSDLILTRPTFSTWHPLLQPHTYIILAAFWLAALLLAWLITQSLVRPLRNLARQLPAIETTTTIHLPEATRKDEIGDLARAFLRTRKALQHERQQRAHAEKLALLGRMTAALAHEIQNPLSAIKMHAQLAALDTPFPAADLINTEADRISDLINQWLFLSKPEPPAKSPINLHHLLQQTLHTHTAQTQHSKITTHLHLPSDLIIPADQRRLQQIFSNLINNAIQAMPHGGTLTITGVQQNHTATLTFTDTGQGFTPTALQHHREFFYSEKEGGMGIGLSVVSEILKAHHGTLTITNQPPPTHGAIITLTLPTLPTLPAPLLPLPSLCSL